MELFTSCYKNSTSSNMISISGDGGKMAQFQGPRIEELAPKKVWWEVWHSNIGKIPEIENTIFYITSYYQTVLKNLCVDDVLTKLKEGSILTCYEEPEKFCHRTIVAVWIELFYDLEVREVSISQDGKKKIHPRNKYYKLIKATLEELIKKDIDMHGYSCIAAAHAYEQSILLACEPSLCDEFPVNPEMYQALADTLESLYRERQEKGKNKAI